MGGTVPKVRGRVALSVDRQKGGMEKVRVEADRRGWEGMLMWTESGGARSWTAFIVVGSQCNWWRTGVIQLIVDDEVGSWII